MKSNFKKIKHNWSDEKARFVIQMYLFKRIERNKSTVYNA